MFLRPLWPASEPFFLNPVSYTHLDVYKRQDKNSLFKHNEAKLFLAFENGKAVGRIMGVIPTDYNKFHGKNDARFSFFECFENKEVFNALISAVETLSLIHI